MNYFDVVSVIAGLVVVYAAFQATRSFKLAAWKQGWVLVAAGGILYSALYAAILLELATVEDDFIHNGVEVASFALIAIGVLTLSGTAKTLWGER